MRQPAFADLHSHTRASDGALSPTALVERALGHGVKVLALTDHDTLAGLEEASASADRMGLRLVPGVEISCDLNRRDVHLLGLFIEPDHPDLVALLEEARAERERASERALRRLADLGVPVTWEEVLAQAEGQTVGRPHFARALVARGHASSVSEVFARWLGDGRPACVHRERPPIAEAARVIAAAGGISALAHPAGYRGSPLDRGTISRLAAVGVRAVEVGHPAHDAGDERRYREIAAGLGLGVTAGSDHHGWKGDLPPGSRGLTEAELASLERLAS